MTRFPLTCSARRMCQMSQNAAAVFVVLAVLVGSLTSSTSAAWFDDFNDGNATDGLPPNPLVWLENLGGFFPGRYDPSSGDYEFQGLNLQPAPEDENLLSIVTAEAFATTSARTRAVTLDGGLGNGGNVGPIVRLDPTTLSGYIGLVDASGNLILDRVDGGIPQELLPFTNIPDLHAGEDVVVQLDAVGDEITLTAWRPGQVQGNDPLAKVTLIDSTYPAGLVGLLWNEDDDDAIGVYRYAKAAGIHLLDGDMDLDDDVDFDDIVGFVQGLTNPDDYETATGLPPKMMGDTDNDGDMDFDDIPVFVAILQNPIVAAQVPEPSTVGLALLGFVGFAAAARRRRV